MEGNTGSINSLGMRPISPCPTCGHCPTCGRQTFITITSPAFPYQPFGGAGSSIPAAGLPFPSAGTCGPLTADIKG